MSSVEEEFLDKISHIDGIEKKGVDVWNCSCQFCGDSKKNKRIKRGYFHIGSKNGELLYSCRNCGISLHFSEYLQAKHPAQYTQYRLATLSKSRITKLVTKKKEVKTKPNFDFINTLPKKVITSIADLDTSHIARRYLESRKISKLNLFTYTENFSRYVDEQTNHAEEYKHVPNDKRIIIPITTPSGEIVGFQGRAIADKGLRYITIKTDKDRFCKVFGLDRYNKDEGGFLLEGPFDSTFLPNSISMCGSSLDMNAIELGYINPSKLVVVMDNEPRNEQIVNKMINMVKLGFRVFVPSKALNTQNNDINDMYKAGMSAFDIASMIMNSSYTGVEALLRIQNWRKA